MDLERLKVLLDRYFDQVLAGAEFTELERMLLESPRAREEFWRTAHWHAFIREWGQAEWGRREAAAGGGLRVLPAPPRRAVTRSGEQARAKMRAWKPLAMAAAILFAFVSIWILAQSRIDTGRTADVPETPQRIAVLTQISDAVWMDASPAHRGGESLSAGWLRLKSGAVGIEFMRGARVVLEGPAEFQLTNSNESFLRSGKLRAMVPETAHGFTVRAPHFSVVDLGTEFGCMVPLTTAAEVHVFKGQIELRDAATQTVSSRLVEKQAVRFENGVMKSIAANPASFLDEEGLARREHRKALDRFSLWREVAHELDANPATLVHFDFEGGNGWQRTLVNRALQSPSGANASIIGCDWENGRWARKGALEFKRADDRVRLSLPEPQHSATLFAWVRVDSLPNLENGLLMTEGSQPGELHWYLYRDGGLGLGVRVTSAPDPGAWRNFRTEPLITNETLGSWIFVATVFDADTQTIAHYFNGKLVATANPGIHVPLRFDTFEIGNWGARVETLATEERRKSVRNFHGRIDEFAILRTAWSASQIERFYEDSRPIAGDAPAPK